MNGKSPVLNITYNITYYVEPVVTFFYLSRFSYVSAMVPVKSMKEYDMTQEVAVLFSETVSR